MVRIDTAITQNFTAINAFRSGPKNTPTPHATTPCSACPDAHGEVYDPKVKPRQFLVTKTFLDHSHFEVKLPTLHLSLQQHRAVGARRIDK